MRASSSRARCGSAQSPSPAPGRTSPRYSASADALSSAAAAVVAGVEQPGRGGRVAQHRERVDLGRLDRERGSRRRC